MRPPKKQTPPGRVALGKAAVQRGSDEVNDAPHCPVAIDHAALMLDFARSSRTKFHETYFARMAAKLLKPFAPVSIDAALSRAHSLRLQSVGEPGRGGAWS